MIADTTRNGCFERAIARALSERPGATRHVLDIGSGSGLLAMMSVRAGATRVSSLEMVPAMAAVARHVVAANGMASQISVHEVKSTDVEAEALGGRAELLVCELVDNELLGEGTLTSIADARRRLLAPRARVVPSGGALFALPIEWKCPRRGGFDLDEMKAFYFDAPFREGRLAPSECLISTLRSPSGHPLTALRAPSECPPSAFPAPSQRLLSAFRAPSERLLSAF